MITSILRTKYFVAALLLLLPSAASAQGVLNGANTAWILTSTALVLFMTLPGLALFYGGLVRTRNVLSVLMQCFSIAVVVSILWLVVGYSIAFGPSESAYWGGLSKMMFNGVVVDSLSNDIPETVFASFQMTFAIITPALIVGAFAERIKFSAMLLFSALWVLSSLLPCGKLGLGWRLARPDGPDRFRWWHRGACNGRYWSIDFCSRHWTARRLSNSADNAPQPDYELYRRRYALGWVVWI